VDEAYSPGVEEEVVETREVSEEDLLLFHLRPFNLLIKLLLTKYSMKWKSLQQTSKLIF
jgi:hypothetical protein